MLELFLKYVVSKLIGLKADQWESVIHKVIELAEMAGLTDDHRIKSFGDWFGKNVSPSVKEVGITVIRHLAVLLARKKGWIA